MKRANGTGSVIKLSGNRRKPYAVRIAAKDSRGYAIQKYLSYHRTAAEAQRALEEYNNTAVRPNIENYDKTLRDIYDVWSARKYSKAGASSIQSHKAAWKRLAPLYDVKMRKIGIDDWQRIIDQAEAAELSKSSVDNTVFLIRALSSFALERDVITKDYSQFIEIPSIDPKVEKGAFTDIQMAKLKQLVAEGFPWADTALMLCYTGFRINEFLSLTQFSYKAADNYLIGGNKTKAGKNRIIPVHSSIKSHLARWMNKGGETIVCYEGHAITPAWYRKNAFAPIAAAIGVPQATPHWCRHTFATMLNKAGVPELERKRLLGHADKNITDHYTHTDIKSLAKWVAKVA